MFETILDYIARTNLFNFIIFAGIIAYIFVKLDVVGKLDKGTESVAEEIHRSEAAKDEAGNKLSEIEAKVANLEEEVESIIKQSENNAQSVGEKIVTDANKSVENIKMNTQKLIENRAGVLKNDILKKASLASIEVAREHIVNELNNNYDLHNKLIDESIETINGVEL